MGIKEGESVEYLFENTLVALFDIQGYSAFIESTQPKDAISKSRKLYSFATNVAKTDFGSAKTMFWILSDTIIIAIDTNRAPLSFGSAYIFIHACSAILHDSLRFCSLPLRGAIGYGYFYFSENSGKDAFGDSAFLLGDGLVDAAKYEKTQNWLGARFTPKATSKLEQFISDEDGKKLLECNKTRSVCGFGDIPLKNGQVEKGYYVDPFHKYENWREYLPDYFEDRDNKLQNSEILYAP